MSPPNCLLSLFAPTFAAVIPKTGLVVFWERLQSEYLLHAMWASRCTFLQVPPTLALFSLAQSPAAACP